MSSSGRLIPIQIATRTQQSALLAGLQAWLELKLVSEGQLKVQSAARSGVAAATRADGLLDMTLPLTGPFLSGLEGWLQLGLLSQVELSVDVKISPQHPGLLAGLEDWLQRGLLCQADLQHYQSHLTCPLPPAAPQRPPVPAQLNAAKPQVKDKPPSTIATPKPPSRLKQSLQHLATELSVLWLLLLGAFMVVISSGVLAASQWERFPPYAQYGILWLYTLGFWGSSLWAGRQANLRLTAQTLRILALLLVPLNVLVLDSFGLWRSPLQWVVAAIALASLTGLTVQTLRAQRPFRAEVHSGKSSHRLSAEIPLLVYLGLSYLHLGWGLGHFSFWAVYLGVVGTTVLSRYYSPQPAASPTKPAAIAPSGFNGAGAAIIYAIGVLLLRALCAARSPFPLFGLAIGLSGWLLIQQSPLITTSMLHIRWRRFGWAVLASGWLMTVFSLPGQAFAVSGLGAVVLARRVLRTWSRAALSGLLLTGLQMVWLAWRVVPLSGRDAVVAGAAGLAGTETAPAALLSMALLPYLGVILVLFDGLARLRRLRLAKFTGGIALAFGAALMALSLVSPLLRTVNFGFSTLALGWVTQRQQRRHLSFERSPLSIRAVRSLAAFVHLGGLFTTFWLIDGLQPRLGLVPWAAIGLGLFVWEGTLSLKPSLPLAPALPATFAALLHRSAGWFGLSLSGLTYGCLLANLLTQEGGSFQGHPVGSPLWGALWLVVPVTLTEGIAQVRSRRRLASQLSGVALGIAQTLTLGVPEVRLLSLGLTTGLMWANTYYLQQRLVAALTLGFGLSFVGALVWQLLPQLSGSSWLLLGAIAPLGLWGLRQRLARRDTRLAQIYRQALDRWAIALCCFGLGLTTFAALGNLPVLTPASLSLGRLLAPLPTLLTVLLLIGAATYRSWHCRPLGLWLSVAVIVVGQIPAAGLPWVRELSLAAGLLLMTIQTRKLLHWASAAVTIGLGLTLAGSLLRIGLLWMGLPTTVEQAVPYYLLIAAIAVVGLGLIYSPLQQRPGPLATAYSRAVARWAIALGGLTLVALTAHSLLLYWGLVEASPPAIAAAAVAAGFAVYRTWKQPTNWILCVSGWSLELLTLEVLGLTGRSLVALAIANTVLGLVAQLMGDWWHRRTQRTAMLRCWHILPLAYGALGSLLRWNLLASWTGLSTLGLMLIAIGVGRRRAAFKPLLYLAVAGISLSAYELLLGQVRGLLLGDQLLAMAALSAAMVYAYRILAPWLTGCLRLTREELLLISHLHWALGSLLLVGAVFYPAAAHQLAGLGAGVFLTRYAILQGRRLDERPSAIGAGEIWVSLGLLEAAALALYLGLTVPALSVLGAVTQPWTGAIASLAAAAAYLLPWRRWGWSPRPWRLAAMIAPLGAAGSVLLRDLQVLNLEALNLNALNLEALNGVSLLAMALFYGWLAQQRQQPRWLYIALSLVGWWAWALLPEEGAFAKACLVGLLVLGVTGFEPACQSARGRSLRHGLRCLGLGVIALFALGYHAQPGTVPGAFGLAGIAVGLGLRIRAALYVGTATFLAIALYQMVLLVFAYPMLKWALGLLVGLGLIWVAASFETRRYQLAATLQSYLAGLRDWQ